MDAKSPFIAQLSLFKIYNLLEFTIPFTFWCDELLVILEWHSAHLGTQTNDELYGFYHHMVYSLEGRKWHYDMLNNRDRVQELAHISEPNAQ